MSKDSSGKRNANAETEELAHKQQVHERNRISKPPNEAGYCGVPPGEEGQYGMRRNASQEPADNDAAQGESAEAPTPEAPDLPLNPTGKKGQGNSGTQVKKEGRDNARRDNPYGGDRRYAAGFDRAGYGGPGVGSDKE